MLSLINKNKKYLYLIVFSIIGIFLWQYVSYVLEKPKEERWDNSGLEYSYQRPDYYDVLTTGTSMAVVNISNQELYSKYGIASMTLGEPEQPLFLTYYTLKEALNYQTPEVVIFDIQSLFYTDDFIEKRFLMDEQHYIHFSLDTMKNGNTKKLALEEAKRYLPDLDVWNYYIGMYYNHSNWQDLTKDNFIRCTYSDIIFGNWMSLIMQENLKRPDSPNLVENTNDLEDISENSLKYFAMLVDLCREKNIELLLVRSSGTPFGFSWERDNAVNNLAQQYDLNFIDFNLVEEEIGFDWSTDTVDGGHSNVSGAKKWTDYIGSYLTEHYDFQDRREDSKYDEYKENEEKYTDYLDAMNTKIALYKQLHFKDYLEQLAQIDTSDNVIMIAISDDGTAQLDEEDKQLLKDCGFQMDFSDKFRYSYVGIKDNNGVEENASEGSVSYSKLVTNDTNIEVNSGGALSDTSASIKVNGSEMVSGGRGFNIAVYNTATGNMLSSVYFDTYLEANPQTRIIKDGQTMIETDVNYWEKEE